MKEVKKPNILFLIIPILLGLLYLIYNIYISINKIDYIFSIVNGSLLSLLIMTIGIILYTNKSIIKKTASVILIILILSIVDINVGKELGFIKFPNRDTLKDFTNKNIATAIKWTSKNNIELIELGEYSELVDEGIIISQETKAGTLTKNVKQLKIIVSKGPNPDTKVDLKDFTGTNIDTALIEIKKLKLKNIDISYTFSDIEQDEIIKQSKTGKINRDEEVTFEISLGNEEDLQPVKLIDLTNKTKFDATLWLKRNGIKYEIKEEFNTKIKRNNVISTNPKKDTIINQQETTLELTLSKGKKIKVPDLSKMSLEEIIKWADTNHINIKYSSEYDNELKKGKIKYISCKLGDNLKEEDTIYITTSLGTLKMIDHKNDITKLRNFAATYNLTINESLEYSDTIEKGQIIEVSHKKGDIINSKDPINVTISLGKQIQVPDFTNMNISKAKSLCKEKNLDCTTSYRASSKSKDIVFGQNKKANSIVIENTNIILYVSNGKEETKSNNNNSSSNNNSNNNTTNNNNPSNDTPTPTPPSNTCDTSKKTTLNILAGDTGEQTKNMINSANKDVKFNWNMVTSCPNGDSTPGTVCNGNTLDGKQVDYCTTITVTIVK